MTKKAKLSPRRRSAIIYAMLSIALIAVVGLAIVGALTSSWRLVAVMAAVLVLLAFTVGAQAYRRLIRAARQSQRNSLLAVQDIRANREGAVLRSPEPDSYRTEPAAESVGKSLGALEWWALEAGLDSSKLTQRLTVVRSTKGRDLLAKMATSGRWTWNELARALEAYRLGGAPRHAVLEVLSKADLVRIVQLADLCYRQNCLPQDIRNAASLYLLAFDFGGSKNFQKQKRVEFFLDAVNRAGLTEDFQRCQYLFSEKTKKSGDFILFQANAANPGKDANRSEQAWLAMVNALYTNEGLAPLTLRPGTEPACLRLSAKKMPSVSSGPLVSIVMPVFRPDEVTDLAIQSALDQTYANIEILIVDDGSGGEYEARLRKWERVDSRVSVTMNERNSGAYTSRNLGFKAARGKYLTVFDGDDWQHPQKIEKLVEASETAEGFQLVSAPWSRVDEDLFFQYRGWRGLFVTPSHVSTMFPMDVIREKTGFWDTVRKAADTEYILRYQLLVNAAEPIEASTVPLTLSLVGESNLSIEDFRLGYRSPDRVSYRSSYEHWHKAITGGASNGYMDFPLVERNFPAPAKFLPVKSSEAELDLVLIGDFDSNKKRNRHLFAHLAQARATDLRIGLCQIKSVLTAESMINRFDSELMDAFAAGELTRVQITDAVRAEAVIAYEPTAYQFSVAVSSGITAENLYVHAEEPPFDAETGRHSYEVFTVADNLHGLFKKRPVWVPGSEVTHNVLRAVLTKEEIILAQRNEWSEVYDNQNSEDLGDVLKIIEYGSERLIHGEGE